MRVPKPVLVLVLAAIGTLGGSGAVAVAAPETVTQETGFARESWYQADPACALPTSCPVTPPPIDSYGDGTLHVAASGGFETARTYLGLSSVTLPASTRVLAARLTVPVDTTGPGSLQPATAALQVCLASMVVGQERGSFASLPPTDCALPLRMTYLATPSPRFEANVLPLLAGQGAKLARGDIALAIVPRDLSPASSWHVVWSARDRADKSISPASLKLTRTASPGSGHVDADVGVDLSAPSVPGDPVVLPPTDLGPPRPDIPAVVDPTAPGPVLAAPAEPVMTPLAHAAVEIPFQYPGVLLLPFGLLLLATVFIKVMCADMSVPEEDLNLG